ncbi:MAG: sulfotransferase domain-containing protein [Solirubrobacterales bacterium]
MIPNAYLCSYPKSGRTWMRYALVSLLDLRYELGGGFDMENMFGLIPNRDGEGATQPWKTPDNYQYADRPEIPFLIASHLRWEPAFAETPTVLLVRSPGDVVVSRYHHMTRHEGKFSGTLAEFARSDQHGLPDLLAYLASWEPHLEDPGITVLTYEELKSDPVKAFGRLTRGLGLDFDRDSLEAALEAASVDRMRKVEAESGVGQPQAYNFNDPDARRVRKAKVGSWREEMEPETVELMVSEIEASPSARELLEKLGLIPELDVLEPDLAALAPEPDVPGPESPANARPQV